MFMSTFLPRIIRIAAILMLSLSIAQPVHAAPDNDNFANAIAIPPDSTLPVSVYTDNTGATFEAGEPYQDCLGEYPAKTVWYSYTSPVDAKFSVFAYEGLVTVYEGNSLASIQKIGYQSWCDVTTFQAQAGTTYYFQLTSWYDSEGSIGLLLDFTPDPQVSIEIQPEYPNLLDDWIAFQAYFYDPVGVYEESYLWTLWDGTTMTGYDIYRERPFTEDGDYPVSVTVTTLDGRSATASTIAEVRTRDIAIAKINTSQVVRANQTREITVELTNRRSHPCEVQVELYKGVPGGNEFVDYLTVYLPVGSRRPILVKFNYTFTAVDAAFGKVTFAVVANIIDGRDALPADNTAFRTVTVR